MKAPGTITRPYLRFGGAELKASTVIRLAERRCRCSVPRCQKEPRWKTSLLFVNPTTGGEQHFLDRSVCDSHAEKFIVKFGAEWPPGFPLQAASEGKP